MIFGKKALTVHTYHEPFDCLKFQISCDSQFNETINILIAFLYTEHITYYFDFKSKRFITFSKNSSETKESTYAEIENQPSGDSTYQVLYMTTGKELTASKSEKVYQNLELV